MFRIYKYKNIKDPFYLYHGPSFPNSKMISVNNKHISVFSLKTLGRIGSRNFDIKS